MKRIIIRWGKKTPRGIKGIVTLDHFKEGNVTSILETFTCSCRVNKGSVSISGIGPKGLIVPLTEGELDQVKELMDWYFAGRNKEKETYCWFPKE